MKAVVRPIVPSTYPPTQTLLQAGQAVGSSEEQDEAPHWHVPAALFPELVQSAAAAGAGASAQGPAPPGPLAFAAGQSYALSVNVRLAPHQAMTGDIARLLAAAGGVTDVDELDRAAQEAKQQGLQLPEVVVARWVVSAAHSTDLQAQLVEARREAVAARMKRDSAARAAEARHRAAADAQHRLQHETNRLQAVEQGMAMRVMGSSSVRRGGASLREAAVRHCQQQVQQQVEAFVYRVAPVSRPEDQGPAERHERLHMPEIRAGADGGGYLRRLLDTAARFTYRHAPQVGECCCRGWGGHRTWDMWPAAVGGC